MAVKQSYGIRASLNRNILDYEIPLGGSVFIPTKSLLFQLGSVLALLWVVTSSWVSSSGPILITLVVLWWIIASLYLGKPNKTKELNISTVPAALEYAQPANRRIVSRSYSEAGPFYSVSLMQDIDETGFITFHDGSFGQMYHVVGSGSILLFEEDKQQILRRVDAFWRKVDVEEEYIFLTTKEPQRVDSQIAYVGQLNAQLQFRTPELFDLLEERLVLLRDHVGGNYNSIHQYLMIKSSNRESLRKAHQRLMNEAYDSSLVFTKVDMLDQDEAIAVLQTVYQSGRV